MESDEIEVVVVMRPMWEKCDCGDYWCHLHGEHAHECICPDIEVFVDNTGEMPYDIMVPVIYDKGEYNDLLLLEEEGEGVVH